MKITLSGEELKAWEEFQTARKARLDQGKELIGEWWTEDQENLEEAPELG
jgi:hypothetical protein